MLKYTSLLLVDDDLDDQLIFKNVIIEIDPSIKFLAKEDGQEAISYLKQANELPEIIFLDLNMPRLGGKQCLAILKADKRLTGIPTIIYSTYKSPESEREAISLGADYYLQKPVNHHDLYDSLKFILTDEFRTMIKF